MKKRIGFAFLFFGISLFILFLYKFGMEAFQIIKLNINFYYFFIFVAIVLISFLPYVMRFKVIIDSFGKKVSLIQLIKQTIAGFSVSYVTPASRLGGEPVRIYMLKKESNIDYITATSSVFIDKFVEILGSALYGIIGLILLMQLPGLSLNFKILFGFLVFLALLLLYWIFHRYKHGKDVISKVIRFTNIKDHVREIDKQVHKFFKYKKKILFKSFMYYVISGVFFILEFKFLLLSIGVDTSLGELILIINVWGILNFVPSPGSIGFLEVGQAGLFHLLQGSSAEGLAMTLVLRSGYLLVVCLGFFIISKFGIKQFFKKDEG